MVENKYCIVWNFGIVIAQQTMQCYLVQGVLQLFVLRLMLILLFLLLLQDDFLKFDCISH